VRIVQGDAQVMAPFEADTFDSAYAVYSLKYFTTLEHVMRHTYRVLKPGGYFLIYDIIKTPEYDPKNQLHAKIVSDFEYSCGMPSLHTQQSIIKDAKHAGFNCVTQMETAREVPWYYEFDISILRFCMTSEVVQKLLATLENAKITPTGLLDFLKIFVAGNVMGIVRAGELKILSGSRVLVFQKPMDHILT